MKWQGLLVVFYFLLLGILLLGRLEPQTVEAYNLTNLLVTPTIK